MLRLPIAAIAAAAIICSAAMPAVAQQAEACAAKYHAELTQLNSSRGDALGQIFKQMRTGDPALPGRWLFGGLGKPQTAARARIEKVCVEEKWTNGRKRCVRTEERRRPSTEVLQTSSPTADETRVLKSVADFVEGRGAIAEVGNNGRYTWLVQRLTQDLKGYISQPMHPALCSGGREVGEFYESQLSPLNKRVQDVAAVAVKAREAAVMRVREAVGLQAVVDAQERAKAVAVASAASGPGSPALPEAALSREEIARLSAEAAQKIVAASTADALVLAVAPLVAGAPVISDVMAEASVIAKLRRLRTAVLEVQDRVAQGDAPERFSVALFDAGKRALRMIEALGYAELLGKAYQPFTEVVLKTPQSVLAAHKAACTCED